MKKKKILFNLNTFPLVGNSIPLENKIRYWQKSGHEVWVFATHPVIDKLSSSELLLPFHSIELESKSESNNKVRFMIECFRRNFISLFFIKKIEKENFDIVHTISSVLDLVILPFILKTRRKRINWITVFDNTVPRTGTGNKLIRFAHWLFFLISSHLIRRADRVFAPSSNVESYLREHGIKPDRIIPTGNGVEVDLIKTAKKRAEIKIDALYIGRINEAKGVFELIKVLSVVKERFPQFKLAIMGDGEEATVSLFKASLAEAGLTSNVSFLGYKTGQEKYDIIKSSKSFWFFSESEGFPQAVMEAASSGLRCFVYALPAYEYYKNDELNIFAQKDYKAAAESVIELFGKKDFYNKAGVALLDNFTWERIAKLELQSIS